MNGGDIFEATVTSKGQVTLPVRLRAMLGLKSGDKLVFHRDGHGGVRIEARTSSLGDLVGIVRDAPGSVTGGRIAGWIDESRGARWRSSRR